MNDLKTGTVAGEMPRVSQSALWQNHKMVAVGRLLDGVAHEFNNLMQGVMASLELTRKLIGSGRAAEAEPFLVKAVAAAQQATLLNQRVAHFVREQPIALKTVSINATAAEVEQMLRFSLSGAFKLEITPAADLWTVCCDPGQAEVAIVDMVLDARDSIPGGGTIAVATRNVEHRDDPLAASAGHVERHRVCVTVTATVRKKSEMFDQGATTLTPMDANQARERLGMVELFARIHGGEFTLRRDAGRQTATELCLPRSPAL